VLEPPDQPPSRIASPLPQASIVTVRAITSVESWLPATGAL